MALGSYAVVVNPWWHRHVTQPLLTARDALTPDPQTTHVALQIADQFAGMASDFAVSGFNPYVFGAVQGGKRVTEELDKGKGLGTSLSLGAVDAVQNLAFTALPMGLTSKALPLPKWLQGGISGAAIGVGLGSAGEMANQAVLDGAGYPEEAKLHDWANPTALALNAAFGAAFGGLHPHVLPSHQDAVLTANDAQAIQSPDGLAPATPKAAGDMVDGMNKAVADLVAGEPVTSAIPVAEKAAIPEDLMALAGNKLSRGERKGLEWQKADLEYKLRQIDEGDYTQHGLDLANERQAVMDAENAGKRIPARKLAAQRKANLEAATGLGEEIRQQDATPHREALGRIDGLLAKDDEARAAHAEISRIEQRHLSDNGFVRHPDVQKMQDAIDNELQKADETTFVGDFGPIYRQFKHDASGAIAHLAQQKDGEAVGALYHPEVGDIDLVWGKEGTGKSNGYGLSKLLKYHPEVIDNLQGILQSLTKNNERSTERRLQLESGTHQAAVKLEWNGNRKSWLLTAFEKKTGDNTRTDIIDINERDGTARSLSSPDKNIIQPATNASKTDTPDVARAREVLPSIPNDRVFEIEHDDGTMESGTAAELMAGADDEAAFADKAELATDSAMTCFLRFGDL